jgi:sulfotransferase
MLLYTSGRIVSIALQRAEYELFLRNVTNRCTAHAGFGKLHMTKQLHFCSGLPRAGSTLLQNILGQNGRFHVTPTSGIIDVVFNVRNYWDQQLELRASSNQAAKLRVLRGILNAFYEDNDKPVVIDKSRSWLALLEMAETLLGRKAKVLVPVRDLRDVLASYEKLYRRQSAVSQTAEEREFFVDFQTVAGRCAVWMRPEKPIGLAARRINDAVQRGFWDRMHFVHFEQLTRDPERTMRDIYEFLEEPYFRHDFEHVQQLTQEDDTVHGFEGMHVIRPRVEPAPSQWREILGKAGDAYAGPYVWDQDFGPVRARKTEWTMGTAVGAA